MSGAKVITTTQALRLAPPAPSTQVQWGPRSVCDQRDTRSHDRDRHRDPRRRRPGPRELGPAHVRDRYAEAAIAASSAPTTKEAASSQPRCPVAAASVTAPEETAIDGRRSISHTRAAAAEDGCCSDFSGGTYGLDSVLTRLLGEVFPDAALPGAARLRQSGRGRRASTGRDSASTGSAGISSAARASRIGPRSGDLRGYDRRDADPRRRNAADAGAGNVEFRKGTRGPPTRRCSVERVISNCVINPLRPSPRCFARSPECSSPEGQSRVVHDCRPRSSARSVARYVGCHRRRAVAPGVPARGFRRSG